MFLNYWIHEFSHRPLTARGFLVQFVQGRVDSFQCLAYRLVSHALHHSFAVNIEYGLHSPHEAMHHQQSCCTTSVARVQGSFFNLKLPTFLQVVNQQVKTIVLRYIVQNGNVFDGFQQWSSHRSSCSWSQWICRSSQSRRRTCWCCRSIRSHWLSSRWQRGSSRGLCTRRPSGPSRRKCGYRRMWKALCPPPHNASMEPVESHVGSTSSPCFPAQRCGWSHQCWCIDSESCGSSHSSRSENSTQRWRAGHVIDAGL